MSFVTVDPESLSAAAGSLQGVGHTVNTGMAFAARPTIGVAPPAADPVSGLTAGLFAGYAQAYQAIAAEAAAAHEKFVTTMTASANSYATTESASAAAAASTSTTEIEGVLETWINGAITSPAQVYLSGIVPYLLGIVSAATALTFEPVATAPGAGLVGGDSPVAVPDQHAWPDSGGGILVSASPTGAGANAETGRVGTLGCTVTMPAFSAPGSVADAARVANPGLGLTDAELVATPAFPAAAPGNLYGEPAAPVEYAAEGASSRVGTRSVVPHSPAGG